MSLPQPADLVVHGGTVVNAGGRSAATVVVGQGRVLAVQDPSLPLPPHRRAVDATG
ncbi:MAG: dihydropyrimidinase, partial [Pseudonocardiales bacterium]|nr:dihydropyrimidinase [Pseudonocardiales bacterium]